MKSPARWPSKPSSTIARPRSTIPKRRSLQKRDPGLSARTNRLASALNLANRRIYESALQHPEQRGMGATIIAAWTDGPLLSIAHVGDSRIYLLRGGALQQLTADHSLVAEQVRSGLISKQQAEVSELQNVLTRALGPHAEVLIDAAEHPLQPGDAIVLCTDGLRAW